MTRKKKHGWGGARPGAGRPKSGRRVGPPHRARLRFARGAQLHVAMTVREDHPDLRTRRVRDLVHGVLDAHLDHPGFRIVRASLTRDQIHLFVEVKDAPTLSREMRSLTVRLSYALAGGTRARVFRERYHAAPVTTGATIEHVVESHAPRTSASKTPKSRRGR